MIRLIVIALLLALVCIAATKLVRKLKTSNLDWTGLAFAAGYVALAFHLRHVTGWG